MRPPVAPPTQRPPRPPSPPRAPLAPLTTILTTGLALALAHIPDAAARTAPELEWHAPAGCPDQARVLEHIHRVVGPALATADALTRVQARVEPHGDAWQLVVVFTGRDATRERRLTLRDCESTANATALLVAIAIAGAAPTAPIARELPPALAIESPHSESTPPAPIITPAPEPISTPAPVIRPPPPPRAAPRLLLQAGPAVAVGILPRVTPGLQLALGAAWPRLRLTLGYARWFRSPARLAARPEVGTDLSLHLATVRLGPVRSFGPLALQPQLGLEFGALRALGIGSAVTFDRRSWWGAALLGAALAWAPRALRGRGALLLQTDLVLALHRPAFTLGPAVPIFRLGPVGLRLALLLEARLF